MASRRQQFAPNDKPSYTSRFFGEGQRVKFFLACGDICRLLITVPISLDLNLDPNGFPDCVPDIVNLKKSADDTKSIQFISM